MSLTPFKKGFIFAVSLALVASFAFAEPAATTGAAPIFNKAFAVGISCVAVAFGVSFVGYAAATAVGRNPGAAGEVLKIGIIAMAFVEAIAFYVLFLLQVA